LPLHTKKHSTAFVDGHVKSVSPEATMQKSGSTTYCLANATNCTMWDRQQP
jgi:prepilin-type processing-associated H-X9-DG protein